MSDNKRPTYDELLNYVQDIARWRKDGEYDPAENDGDDTYVLENDTAVDLHDAAVSDARTLLGITDAGQVVTATCRHCGRGIAHDGRGSWVDPEATGDDRVWRETCDAHDTRAAEHEPRDSDPGDETVGADGQTLPHGRCDTCGAPCDADGCTTDRNHPIALEG